MFERTNATPVRLSGAEGVSTPFVVASPTQFGDPSLELFGQGWSPRIPRATDTGSYVGRHRAPDA
jgi:hypothetical protein